MDLLDRTDVTEFIDSYGVTDAVLDRMGNAHQANAIILVMKLAGFMETLEMTHQTAMSRGMTLSVPSTWDTGTADAYRKMTSVQTVDAAVQKNMAGKTLKSAAVGAYEAPLYSWDPVGKPAPDFSNIPDKEIDEASEVDKLFRAGYTETAKDKINGLVHDRELRLGREARSSFPMTPFLRARIFQSLPNEAGGVDKTGANERADEGTGQGLGDESEPMRNMSPPPPPNNVPPAAQSSAPPAPQGPPPRPSSNVLRDDDADSVLSMQNLADSHAGSETESISSTATVTKEQQRTRRRL